MSPRTRDLNATLQHMPYLPCNESGSGCNMLYIHPSCIGTSS